MRAAHVFAIAVLGFSALPVMAAPAVAEPPHDTFPVSCDNGQSYVVDVMGNGDFTPAHIKGSTRVFVPHQFGETTAELRDADGNLVDTFTEPASVQGSGKQKGDLTCTFSFFFSSDGSDPEGPPAGYTFSGTGTATGHLSGR